MILKLRKKFIKITMISVICVLFGIIAFINVFNYMNVRQNAILRLEMLTENNGQMLNAGPFGGGFMEEPSSRSNRISIDNRDTENNFGSDIDDMADIDGEEDIEHSKGDSTDDTHGTDDLDDIDGTDDLDDIDGTDDVDDIDDSNNHSDDPPPFPDSDDDGRFSGDDNSNTFNDGFPGDDSKNTFYGGLFQAGISAESRYDARYFTVTLDESGEILSTDTRNIASVSESDAGDYAAAAFAKGKKEGFCKHYRFAVIDADDDSDEDSNEDSGVTYVFLNCERELSSFWNFLIISIIISVIGVILVFLLVLVLSKKAIRPIAENYKKQKQFITDAGHELKTPLTIIGAYAEMIEMDDPDNEYATGIHNQVKRLTDLTNNLIYLSKTEEGEYTMNIAEFSLSDEIREALIPYYDLAAKENKVLSDHIDENVLFKGDRQAIRRLITLLMDNALKYADDHGTISVLLNRSGSSITLRVQNTVDEIEQGDLDILFERFYRRDASRNSATGGSGIGLSTAKAIVESHRGMIHASSPDGKSFIIQIQWKICS